MKETMMMKVQAQWDEKRATFKLLPITLNSTFLECRFNLDEKILILLHKERYQQYKMLPQIDSNGEVAYVGGKVKQGEKPRMKTERKLIDGFYDSVIHERADIQKFVDLMTGESVNLDEYYKVPEVDPTKTEVPASKNLEVVKE